MAGSEAVFDIIQFGTQGGTAYAPGSAAAALHKFPIDSPVNFDLDRAATYPKQDRGRNARNSAGVGYFGVRKAGVTLPAEVRFEDIADLLELHWAGGIAPTGPDEGGYYTRVYPLEAATPTIIPATIEGGSTDAAEAQQRLVSALIDSLTLGFSDVSAGSASPWTASAVLVAIDREINDLTADLDDIGGGTIPLETVMGHLTRLYEGTTGTAFAALAELAGSLKSFTMTTNRHLALRAYGSDSDLADRFGFTDMTDGTIEAKVGISSTSKSDFHDIWDVASPASLGERRWRLKAIGTGSKLFQVDLRVGITAVPYDESDGERLFKVTAEPVDDSTLDAQGEITIINKIAGS